MDYFSHSEVPSLCVRDVHRTNAFHQAIRDIVREGDVVLDIGAGSGILSFFSTECRPKQVYSVEVDESLARQLVQNATKNGLGSIVKVICGDIREVSVPEKVDVVIAEMIETWLLDELQVPAIQGLRDKGIITSQTKLIPAKYDAKLAFGYVNFQCYGYQLPFPVHAWPDLDDIPSWLSMPFSPKSQMIDVFSIDFHGDLPQSIEMESCFTATSSGELNAVALSGIAHLCSTISLGATVAFNGVKYLPIKPMFVSEGEQVNFSLAGGLGKGGGLEGFGFPLQNEHDSLAVLATR